MPKAAALQQSLTKFLTAAYGQGGQAAVIEVNEHRNALIIQATKQDQQRIIRLVDNLDRPRPQVHLKAYIVQATRETARELGVPCGGVWRSGSFGNGNHAWIRSRRIRARMCQTPLTAA
jgi:Type II secretory pathway, component PulD